MRVSAALKQAFGATLMVLLLSASPAKASHELLTTWGTSGIEDGQFAGPRGIATDSKDNVYVTDSRNQRVQKFDSSGTFIRKWGSEGAGESEFGAPRGIATDSRNKVYVADRGAEEDCDERGCTFHPRIQVFNSSGGFIRKWGLGSTRDDSGPIGVATDSDDNVYVADRAHGVRVFDSSGAFLRLLVDPNEDGYASANAVSVDDQDRVHVAGVRVEGCNSRGGCSYLGRIQVFGVSGELMAEWRGPASPAGIATDSQGHVYVGSGGLVSIYDSSGERLASWSGLSGRGIATDSEDNVYVVGDDEVHKLDPDGGLLPLASWGNGGVDDGEFLRPSGIATDSRNNVYITDSGNHRVQKFDSSGNFLRKWGSEGGGEGEFIWSAIGGTWGIATDSRDNVYVADDVFGTDRIQVFDPSGNFVRAWEPEAEPGIRQQHLLSETHAIAIDSKDNVYVLDWGAELFTHSFFAHVQVFDRFGSFLREWGRFAGRFPAEDGEFYDPRDIAIDSEDNVYVTDIGGDTDARARVQVFDTSGNFITKWEGGGSGIAIDSHDNVYGGGLPIQVRDTSGALINEFGTAGVGAGHFSGPRHITTDSDDRVYVVDGGAPYVQKFAPLGQPLPTISDLVDSVEALRLPQGLERSLVSRLEEGQMNPKRSPESVCNALGAFANQASALSDKQIEAADAEALVAAAELVRASEGCA